MVTVWRSYNKAMSPFPIRRNTLVLSTVLVLLAVFAWAGWANWEYRQQAAAHRAAMTAMQGEMVPTSASDAEELINREVAPLNGKPAPAFTLENLDGKKVSLSSYRGKALLINFWATWCGPCKIETPWLVELRDKYAQQGFEILGVSTEGDDVKPSNKTAWEKDKAAVAKFVNQERVPYPMLMDGDSISRPYGGLDDLPTSFFVDRKGTVVAAQVGLTSKSDIEAKIKKALAD